MLLRFIILFVITLGVLKKTQPYAPESTLLLKALVVAFIANIVLGYVMKENFFFEVTPWKKTCLGNDACPQCCPKGFGSGMNVGFEYTSDTDRLNECRASKPFYGKNRVTDYENLQQTGVLNTEGYCGDCGIVNWNTAEGYCQNCPSGNQYYDLQQTYNKDSLESYCNGACASASGADFSSLASTWLGKMAGIFYL